MQHHDPSDISLLLFCAPDGKDLLHACGIDVLPPSYLSSFGSVRIKKEPVVVTGGGGARLQFLWVPKTAGITTDWGDWYEYITNTDFPTRPLVRTEEEHDMIDGYLSEIKNKNLCALASLVNFLRDRWRIVSKLCLLWRDTDILKYKDLLKSTCPEVLLPETVDEMYDYSSQINRVIQGMALLESRCLIGGYQSGKLSGMLFTFPVPTGKVWKGSVVYVKAFEDSMYMFTRACSMMNWDMGRIANALVRIMEDRQILIDIAKPKEILHVVSLRWTIRKLLMEIAPKFERDPAEPRVEVHHQPILFHRLISSCEIYLEPRYPYSDPIALLASLGQMYCKAVRKPCSCNFLVPQPRHSCWKPVSQMSAWKRPKTTSAAMS
jgi:hypothetical protein